MQPANQIRERPMTSIRRLSLLTAVIVIAVLPILSACNTTAGIGQDLSAAGGALTNSAQGEKGK